MGGPRESRKTEARQGGKLIALRTEHDIPPLHHALRRGLQQNTEDLTGQVLSADQGMVAASKQDGGVGMNSSLLRPLDSSE